MASLRPNFHQNLATRLVEDVFYHRTGLFYFLGKLDPWREYVDDKVVIDQCDCLCPTCINKNGTLVTVQYGDNYEPHSDPDNSIMSETNIRDNILFLKRIGSSDIANVVRCQQWTKGNYYSQWDNTKDMTKVDQPYFVYNSKNEVFKCLYNNKKILGNQTYELSPSTIEPSGVNYDVTYTNDGYIWKYLYTMPRTLVAKFKNSTYIPVMTSLSSTFYNRGGIDEIIVVNGGAGYSSETKTFAEVSAPDDPNGEQATISLFVNDKTGSIDTYYIDNKGSGYSKAPTIRIRDIQGDGIGKYGNPTAILEARILNGSLDSVSIIDPGLNYSGDTATTIAVSGDGTGCIAYPRILNGRIVGVIIAETGSDYTWAKVTATCSINPQDVLPAVFETKIGGAITVNSQSVVQQTAVNGAIFAIELTEGGYDYTSGTEVIIDGDGEGCTAHTVVENGRIAKVIVDKWGEGYTYAKITFLDKNRKVPNENPEAKAYAILPPIGGHGHDPISELDSRTVCVYTNVDNNQDIIKLKQEFRQYGLIEDVTSLEDHTIVTTDEQLIMFDIDLDNQTAINENLDEDVIVYSNNVMYRVVMRENTRLKLQQISYIYKDLKVGDKIKFTDPATKKDNSYEIVEVFDRPHTNKYSGNILYINNNSPFEMVNNQTFGMRTYLTY